MDRWLQPNYYPWVAAQFTSAKTAGGDRGLHAHLVLCADDGQAITNLRRIRFARHGVRQLLAAAHHLLGCSSRRTTPSRHPLS
jgi:hypothetical protein